MQYLKYFLFEILLNRINYNNCQTKTGVHKLNPSSFATSTRKHDCC